MNSCKQDANHWLGEVGQYRLDWCHGLIIRQSQLIQQPFSLSPSIMKEVSPYLPKYILAMVCQQFCVPYQKALFKSVTLYGNYEGKPSALATFLYQQPHPAPYAMDIERFIYNIQLKLSIDASEGSWLLELLGVVFPRMNHLKSLIIITMVQGPQNVYSEKLDNSYKKSP
jgi:hypothetical protein